MKKLITSYSEFSKLNEGVWSLPNTIEKAKELSDFISSNNIIDPKVAKDKLYNILGDDSLYNELDSLIEDGFDDCKTYILSYIKEIIDGKIKLNVPISSDVMDILKKIK